ncbi:hypothetical protein Rumeso_02821 [Rubellimicrobium mesophilum DSM 19309]|uniref:Uncharacterized protein n=1 Tax=Rubellimicrobium mesophilum DSM 19309 TaxID=442562 RepID=A0A017HMS4_9RHOB|nr:hypothetical protein [Rubellimicrobium mesophilum]EYD75605.1 hypothetical protein Rumeso_02821 [Rubellimicrobium mesophilum DSM 19309]
MPKIVRTLTIATLLAATSALAQEATPAPEEFDGAFTWTAVDLSTVPMGEGQAAYVQETYIVNTDAEGPLAGLAARCVFMGVTDLATTGMRDTGTCVYQDAEGNQLWDRLEGVSAGNGAAYGGSGTWIGGTDRFEGASWGVHL